MDFFSPVFFGFFLIVLILYYNVNPKYQKIIILLNTIYFNRNPTPNILLGDSRVFYITNSTLEHEMGGVATNLSIPGGNYRTIIDLDNRLPFSYIKKYYFDHFYIRHEYTDSLTSIIFHLLH